MITIKGELTSLQVFANRANLVVVHVSASEYSGSFTCPTSAVSLDGAPADRASDVAAFVEHAHLFATVRDVDNASDVGGIRSCAGIDLVTVLD